MSHCRLCLQERKLVKAHIIPAAFFRDLRIQDDELLVLGSGPDGAAKRAPLGVYDRTILCRECEETFSDLDDYGITILLRNFGRVFAPISDKGETIAYQTNSVDQELLLRFVISVIWRASVSTQPFFKHVRLGPFENRAARAITQRAEPIPPAFSAVLCRWKASEDAELLARSVVSPWPERWGPVRGYRFYLGQTVAHVKVCALSFQSPMNHVALTAQHDLYVLARDFDSSKDFSTLKRIVALSPQWPRLT